MQATDLTVEVRDINLARVGQIPLKYLAGFEATLRFNNVGNWSISLPSDQPMAEALRQPGAGLIVTGPDGVLLSGPTASATLDKTKDDPEGVWLISGVDDSVILADRLAYPDPTVANPALSTVANDDRTGKASTIMCAYVDNNIGVSAVSARRIASLIASVDPVAGSTLTGSPRFTILGELLTNLASIDGLGFDVKQVGSALQFSVFQPVDRSAYIRMDIANNTLSKAEYGYASPEATRAIVGGTGVGTERTLLEVVSASATAAESAWGRRIERFVDQNNESDPVVLAQKGAEELAKSGKTFTSVDIVPSSDLTMRYGNDWNLGDKVGVTIGNQAVAATVTTVAIRIDSDGLRIGATVGEPTGLDYEALVARKQTQTVQRVNALELKETSAGASVVYPIAINKGGTGQTTLTASKTALGIPFGLISGRTSVVVTASNSGSTTITFPSGVFTQAPVITATIVGTTAGTTQSFVARVSSVTSTGATIFAISTTASAQTITVSVDWIAMQATSSSATS